MPRTYTDEQKRRQYQNQIARRRKLQKAGLCTRCAEQPLAEHSSRYCEVCLVILRKQNKACRDRKIAAGFCGVCLKRAVVRGCRCQVCIDKAQAVKDAAFRAYGGYVCSCCGETIRAFLTIDHANNDGAEHRQTFTCDIYQWLKKHGYPPGFQVLCWNCNQGKRFNGGVCPHQAIKSSTIC